MPRRRYANGDGQEDPVSRFVHTASTHYSSPSSPLHLCATEGAIPIVLHRNRVHLCCSGHQRPTAGTDTHRLSVCVVRNPTPCPYLRIIRGGCDTGYEINCPILTCRKTDLSSSAVYEHPVDGLFLSASACIAEAVVTPCRSALPLVPDGIAEAQLCPVLVFNCHRPVPRQTDDALPGASAAPRRKAGIPGTPGNREGCPTLGCA